MSLFENPSFRPLAEDLKPSIQISVTYMAVKMQEHWKLCVDCRKKEKEFLQSYYQIQNLWFINSGKNLGGIGENLTGF